MQNAFVGSYEVSNPDAIVGWLGLTGIPVRGVFNGCATGGTSLQMAAAAIRHGEADVAMAIGMDKHPRGAFAADPSVVGLPSWYGQTGMFLTTHFFGTKINRYMGLHGISTHSLASIAAKNLHNGSITPHAWRRKPASVEDHPRRSSSQLPANALDVLRSMRGRRSHSPVSGGHRQKLHCRTGIRAGRRAA